MRKVTETQLLSQNRPVMILMAGILLPILILLIVKLNEESANTGDFFGLLFTILIMSATFLLLFKMKTKVVLSSTEVRYRSFPFKARLDSIPVTEITSAGITKHKWYHGYGYRYAMGGIRVFAMKPGKVLKITTKSGKNYRFGINHQELVKRFIKEEWPNTPFNVE